MVWCVRDASPRVSRAFVPTGERNMIAFHLTDDDAAPAFTVARGTGRDNGGTLMHVCTVSPLLYFVRKIVTVGGQNTKYTHLLVPGRLARAVRVATPSLSPHRARHRRRTSLGTGELIVAAADHSCPPSTATFAKARSLRVDLRLAPKVAALFSRPVRVASARLTPCLTDGRPSIAGKDDIFNPASSGAGELGVSTFGGASTCPVKDVLEHGSVRDAGLHPLGELWHARNQMCCN